jgi:hypothetical protein
MENMTSLNVHAAVVITGEFSCGKVCADCEQDLANGHVEDDQRDMRIVEKNCATYEFSLGHYHMDNEWDRNRCSHYGFECQDDCTCEKTEFDTLNHCDMCGDHLAGCRTDVTMIKRDLLDTNMTKEQFDKLLISCERWRVNMAISDYFVYQSNSSMMAGWAEGWVGGIAYDGTGPMGKTIYLGVSPEGDSHS